MFFRPLKGLIAACATRMEPQKFFIAKNLSPTAGKKRHCSTLCFDNSALLGKVDHTSRARSRLKKQKIC